MIAQSYSTGSSVDFGQWLQTICKEASYHLCIAFCDRDFPFEDIIAQCQANRLALIGCSGSGEIHDHQLLEGGMTALVLSVDPAFFQIHLNPIGAQGEYDSAQELTREVLRTFPEVELIAFASGLRLDGVAIADGIASVLGTERPFFGGLAGDNMRHISNIVFTHNGYTDRGIAALVFDQERIRLTGHTVSGWQPLGKVHTASRSEGNILYEIDGEPALDLFVSYFGEVGFQSFEETAVATNPGQIPLLITKGKGEGTLRVTLEFDEAARALVLAGAMEEGAQFRFCPIAKWDVVDQTIREFGEHAATHHQPDALVLVHCKGRHYAFGPVLEDEVSGIHQQWQKPMVGFLSNGEFGYNPDGQGAAFHNITCSLISLSEY